MYRGHRYGWNRRQLTVDVVRERRAPQPLQHLVRHSPDGFNCGYCGSGPGDLALNMLLDHLGENESTVEAALGADGRIVDDDDVGWWCAGRRWLSETRGSTT